MDVDDIVDAEIRAPERAPKPLLPHRAGMMAAAYCLGAFAVFWFLRTGEAPEILAGLAALVAAYGMGWYDCKLGWKPYDAALDNDRKGDG